MKESFEIKETFNAKPSEIYEAWLNSEKHAKMVDGEAECSSEEGASFTIWDGYIKGKNISLKPNEEIIQSWRTSEFNEDDDDSKVIIRLKEVNDSTELTLIHSNIPEGQTQYKQGWEDHYFAPMREYFKK